MQLLHKSLFLKNTSGKKLRIKAQQGQVTKDLHAADARVQQPTGPQFAPPVAKDRTKMNTTLTVMSLGSHKLEEGLPCSKGKNHQESYIASFPKLKQNLRSFSRGTQPHARTCPAAGPRLAAIPSPSNLPPCVLP